MPKSAPTNKEGNEFPSTLESPVSGPKLLQEAGERRRRGRPKQRQNCNRREGSGVATGKREANTEINSQSTWHPGLPQPRAACLEVLRRGSSNLAEEEEEVFEFEMKPNTRAHTHRRSRTGLTRGRRPEAGIAGKQRQYEFN